MEPGLPNTWSALARADSLARPIVHLVDDDRLVRTVLQRTLMRFDCDIEEHGSAEAFLDKVDPERPNALILDLGLPGMSGLDLLRKLNAERAMVPTIVMSSNDDVRSVVSSIQSGAIDFLPKPPDREALSQSVAKMLTSAPQMLVERRIAAQFHGRRERLTPREQEVFEHMLNGLTPKQVACELGLRPRTSHIHCSNVLGKFDVENANDLLLLRMRVEKGPFGEPTTQVG